MYNTIKNQKIKPERKRCLSSGAIGKNRGFTLLEAMIGFLVLSIGMLGIASLQGIALKAGKTSVYASVAMMKAEELLESMRVNSTVLGDYAGSGGGANNSCSTANCSPNELAQDDLFWWSKNLKAGLPDAAQATIAVKAAAAGSKMATVTVEVKWDERDKDVGGSIARKFTTTSSICTEFPC